MEGYPEFSRWALPVFTSILKRKAEGGLATEEEIGPEQGSESSKCCEETPGAKGAGASRGWKRLPGPPHPVPRALQRLDFSPRKLISDLGCPEL